MAPRTPGVSGLCPLRSPPRETSGVRTPGSVACPGCSCLAAQHTTLVCGGMAGFHAPAPAGSFAAAVLVNGGPGEALGHLCWQAALLVAFGDGVRFAFLFGGVFRFIAALRGR